MEGAYTFVANPMWIYIAPYLATALLGGAIIDQWKKRPIKGAVASASAILVLSLLGMFFGLQIPDVYAFPLLTVLCIGGMFWDSYPFTSYREYGKVMFYRRHFFGPVLFLGLGIFLTWLFSGPVPVQITLSRDALEYEATNEKMTLRKPDLEISEYRSAGRRRWDLSAGVRGFLISNDDFYLDPDGIRISSEELIVEIEDWSGVTRDYAPRSSAEPSTMARSLASLK